MGCTCDTPTGSESRRCSYCKRVDDHPGVLFKVNRKRRSISDLTDQELQEEVKKRHNKAINERIKDVEKELVVLRKSLK